MIGFMVAGILTGKLLAQSPSSGNKEKMEVFKGWVGQWKGEGSMQMGPGEPRKSSVEERIESKLGGSIMVVEGIGKRIDPSTQKEVVVHHAFAVLSFDEQSGSYKFKTYLQDGKSADAWLTTVSENKFQWGFDTPHGKIRYNINLDPAKKTWNEIGERSTDGTNWMKFFEMNLTRVD